MQPIFTKRFENFFNGTGVNLYTIDKNHFIMINSMAMENDGCTYCKAAVQNLDLIESTFVFNTLFIQFYSFCNRFRFVLLLNYYIFAL